MANVVKRNFETGKKLLAAAILLSVNLVIQLFTVAETVDVTEGIRFSSSSLTMTLSYALTAVSMIFVLQEFFQIKMKMKGLLALNALLERKSTPSIITPDTIEPENIDLESQEAENDPLENLVLDDDAEFDSLLDEMDDEETAFDDVPGNPSIPIDEDIMDRYKTTTLKIDDGTGAVAPMMDDGGLQDLIEQADLAVEEDQQLAKIVAESEIIQTLNELENIVQELKTKQN